MTVPSKIKTEKKLASIASAVFIDLPQFLPIPVVLVHYTPYLYYLTLAFEHKKYYAIIGFSKSSHYISSLT